MQPTLKAPGIKRLQLKYDILLFQFCFNFAFTFNSRHYNMGDAAGAASPGAADQPQATDIARCLDGAPLTVDWIGRQVTSSLCGSDSTGTGTESSESSSASAFTLKAYAAPESSSVRGLMSDACRLDLVWEEGCGGMGMPSSVFYKRAQMGDLEYARSKAATAPLKVARDVESYAVEAAFLACASGAEVAAALAAAEVRVPRCFAADLRPCDDDPIESAFALLMEDFAPEQGGVVQALLVHLLVWPISTQYLP